MIDAASFALHHSAFWADHTPTCEHFVRRLNLEWAERWRPPVDKPDEHIRAAFVAEIAFACFCARIAGVVSVDVTPSILANTKNRLAPLMDDPETLEDKLSNVEMEQIWRLENNLDSFFSSQNMKTITRPQFRGCGYVDTSEGDILCGAVLFEVKAVDRQFRSADIKQLIAYSALNHSSKQFELAHIGVFNPRRGTYFNMSIDEISREIAGRSSQDLFDSIVQAVSSGEMSR